MNEDIYKLNNSRRALKLKQLMSECNFMTNKKGPTFLNVKANEVSEIDYFIYQTNKQRTSKRLTQLTSNVSDHYAIEMSIPCQLVKAKKEYELQKSTRTRWDSR